jgi:hypothetical protein
MGKLIYSMLISLDGYTEDEHGRFGWGAPEDEEVHSYINALASSLGAYLITGRVLPTDRPLLPTTAASWRYSSDVDRLRRCCSTADGSTSPLSEHSLGRKPAAQSGPV